MKVFGARCIVKEDKVENTTKSGILLTERKNQQANKGLVIAVGTGAITNNGDILPMNVKVGDRVVYNSFAGAAIVDEKKDESFVIIGEGDILAVLDEEEL